MPTSPELRGTFRGLVLFDLAESIDLARLHQVLGTNPSSREPAFRHTTPEYVRFERPPVMEPVGTRPFPSVGTVEVRIRYFDYGVASVELLRTFRCTWPELVDLAHRWIDLADVESFAHAQLEDSLLRTQVALEKPYRDRAPISEEYFIVQLEPIATDDGLTPISANDLVDGWGQEISQIVRGETRPLSEAECAEVLHSSMSYYPNDLLVLGWVGAFIYDTRDSASPTIDLLEYANTQLLEFRYYDDVLTNVLYGTYKRLEKRHSMWARWKLARQAQTLNTIRLDYQELVERTDNAIKFLGDMFDARVYRLASVRIGVDDYRHLVTEKLTTARDLYDTLVNEFHQGRAFFLEVAVVIILLMEIGLAILGRH